MKFVIIAVAIAMCASVSTAEKNPKLLNPDFLFEYAWEVQEQLEGLQSEINAAIHDAQTALTGILRESTDETLQQYQNYVDGVEAEYWPARELIDSLPESACRDRASAVITLTTEVGGDGISGCAKRYDDSVTKDLSDARFAMGEFDDIYRQVQSIVVKSFVGQNKFLDAEPIKSRIEEISALISDRWSRSVPELEAVKNALSAVIAGHNEVLGRCHQETHQYVVEEYVRARTSFNICNGTFGPAASKSKSATKPEYEILYDEFLIRRDNFILQQGL